MRKRKMFTKAQREIVSDCGCNTHTIWNESMAVKVTTAFGFLCRVWKIRDQPKVAKGAHLSDGKTEIMGVDSEGVLSQIASHKGYKWKKAMVYEGRGFRVGAMAQELLQEYGTPAQRNFGKL